MVKRTDTQNLSRKTSRTYEIELDNLKEQEKRLDRETAQHLLILAKSHPDAIIAQIGNDAIKAMSIASEGVVTSMDIRTRIQYIQRIEAWLLNRQGLKQLEIPFLAPKPKQSDSHGQG